MGEAGVQLTTVEAVVVVALVLSPGYIFTLVARRLIAHVPEATDLRLLLTVVAYGTVIQALLFPLWTHRILDVYLDNTIRQHAYEVYAWAVASCLIVPVALGIVVGRLTLWPPMDRLLDQLGLGYIDRLPSAWDYVARQQHGSWVKIHLKDGRGVIAGIFGRNSVASLAPDRADILGNSVAPRRRGRFRRPSAH